MSTRFVALLLFVAGCRNGTYLDVTVESGDGSGVWAASLCPWAHAAMVATSTAAGKTRDGYEVMGPPLIPNIALIHRDWRHTC